MLAVQEHERGHLVDGRDVAGAVKGVVNSPSVSEHTEAAVVHGVTLRRDLHVVGVARLQTLNDVVVLRNQNFLLFVWRRRRCLQRERGRGRERRNTEIQIERDRGRERERERVRRMQTGRDREREREGAEKEQRTSQRAKEAKE